MHIAHIMPVNATDERKDRVKKKLETYVLPGTKIDVIDYEEGPEDLEYYEDDTLATMLMLKDKKRLDTYDGINIACFYDPGLRELREVLSVPVMGIGLASMTMASLLGHRFSIIVGRKKWIPKMSDNSILYGFAEKIASWRSVGLSVKQLKEEEELSWERISAQAKAAVEDDGAEVIVLGCAAIDNIEERLRDELGVPVINPIFAGIKLTEMQADMYSRFQLSHSRLGDYQPKQSNYH